MANSPYHRGPNWSSAYALNRIAAKRATAQSRLKHIAESVATLEAERSQLLNLLEQLDDAQREEERRAAARGGARPGPPAGPDRPAVEPPADETPVVHSALSASASHGSDPVARSAARASGAGPHDDERCLFVTPRGPAAGSTRPRRVDVSRPGFEDTLLRRGVRMLETPGIIHAMIVADRSQVVLDIDGYRVPEAALGLPLADAYRGHVFSSDALKALSDPERAFGFLAKVTKVAGDDPPSEPS